MSLHVEPMHRLSGAEAADVERLLTEVAGAIGPPGIGEGKRPVLGREPGGGDGVLLARAEGGSLVGVAVLQRHPSSFGVEVASAGHRAGLAEVTGALLEHTVAAVAAEGGGELFYWVHGAVPGEAAGAVPGFSVERELFEMRTPLPLAPDIVAGTRSIVTRPFVVGRDEEAWLAVNNRAFAGHPEQGGWSSATLGAREREPWFDPAGFLLLELDGRLAGSCWTKVHGATDPRRGEIYVIAVDPDFAHRGLGRALTVAGYAHLAGLGLTLGILYVDAANGSAVDLYRSLGLRVSSVDRAYRRAVASGS